MGRWRRYLSG